MTQNVYLQYEQKGQEETTTTTTTTRKSFKNINLYLYTTNCLLFSSFVTSVFSPGAIQWTPFLSTSSNTVYRTLFANVNDDRIKTKTQALYLHFIRQHSLSYIWATVEKRVRVRAYTMKLVSCLSYFSYRLCLLLFLKLKLFM